MRLKLIACNTLTRELGYLSSCCPNSTETTWLRADHCGDPDRLRRVLQAYVDQAEEEGGAEAIVLVTGLCGGAVCGVRSRRIPLVLPRVHDCASLLVGSGERYRDIFDAHNGNLLWLSPGRLEYGRAAAQQTEVDPHWARHNAAPYTDAAYVQLPTVHYPDFRGPARAYAASLGMELTEYGGDDGLLRDLLAAHWDEDRFLVVPPERTCEPSYDYHILKLED